MIPHQRWSTGLLVDTCSLPNAPSGTQGIAYRNRGTSGSGHGWTMGWGVAWNVTTPYFLVSAAPGTENWCIGGIGAKTSRAGNGDPDGIYDSLGTKVTLGATNSLYLEQLRERLGDQALINIGYGTSGGGGGTTVFYEAENIAYAATGATAATQSDTNSSSGVWIALQADGSGDFIDYTLPNMPAGTYDLRMLYKSHPNRGILSIAVNGVTIPGTLDQYAASPAYPEQDFGLVTFATSGNQVVRLTVTGKNPSAGTFTLSADAFRLIKSVSQSRVKDWVGYR